MKLEVQNFGHLIGKYGLYVLQNENEREQILNQICPYENSHEKDIIIFVLQRLFEKNFFEELMNQNISIQIFSQTILEYFNRIVDTKIKHTQSQISTETSSDEIEHLKEKLEIINQAKINSEPIIGNLIEMYKNYDN